MTVPCLSVLVCQSVFPNKSSRQTGEDSNLDIKTSNMQSAHGSKKITSTSLPS